MIFFEKNGARRAFRTRQSECNATPCNSPLISNMNPDTREVKS